MPEMMFPKTKKKRNTNTNTMPLSKVAEEFENFIMSQIDSYAKELNVNIDNAVEEAANEFAEDLKRVTPVGDNGTGKYGHLRDNIQVKKKTKNGRKSFEVNFGDKGFLSTILEYGWTARNGKLVRTNHAFVRPLFDTNKDRYFKKIKDEIERQNGGG